MIPLANVIAEDWFRYMMSATFQATLLALFVLGVLRLGRRWPPAIRHAILMLALLKFLVPPMMSLPTGIFNRISQQRWSESVPALHYVPPTLQNVNRPLQDTAWQTKLKPSRMTNSLKAEAQRGGSRILLAPSVRKPALSVKGTLLLLHLLGALLVLAMAALQQVYLRRLASCASPAHDPTLADTYDVLCRSMKPPARPRLLISGNRHAPITFGGWKPVVMLPQAIIDTLPPQEIRTILAHELAHHRRWDPWLAWIQVIISAAWWFNPVYWLLSRRIRSVREDCCDDLVVSSGIASRESYCRTLLQAARVTRRNPIAGAALAYVGEAQPLHRRFSRIMTAKSIAAPRLAGTGMLAIFALALLLLPGIKPRALAKNGLQAEAYGPRITSAPSRSTSILQNPAEESTAGSRVSEENQTSNADVSGYYYYRKWLEEDVVYLISQTEKDQFLALKTDQERESFIEQFWVRRSLAFKEEHYRRLAYANEHFPWIVPGWKTDRGRFYILNGKPDEIESHPMGGSYATGDTYPFEKWLYRHIEGAGSDIEVEFIDPSRTGEYRMATNPQEKYSEKTDTPGSFYYRIRMENLGMLGRSDSNPATPSVDEVPSTITSDNPKLKAEARYAELLSRYKVTHPDVFRLTRELEEMKKQTATTSSNSAGQSGERALWRLIFQINNQDLQFTQQQQDLNRAIVTIYGKITDTGGRVLTEWEDVIAVEYTDQLLETGKTKQAEYQKIVVLPPGGAFNFDVVVKDENSKKTGIKVWDPINPFERMQQYFDMRMRKVVGR